ncbi:hypothetical protein C8J55DRAFT_511024 [Lentinula edodes]|uniref:F-box domain-containing protein n=1 Tax=Lentinula lateritia TaxID=40482 RepID=A0A9W9DRK2_9AGAR|nr:hypothetical protein C8J55DRAFT_511024 [Lentinula edodes]
MGDWDFYCALCAAPFHTSGVEETLRDFHVDESDQKFFAWAHTLQVIAHNPQASGLSCCYISGDGRCDYYGTARCKPSDDPNCPALSGGSETFDVDTYYNYASMQEGAIPVHRNCLEIFKKALAHEKGVSFSQMGSVDLDPDILFSAMRSKRKSKGLRCLDLDYFELDEVKREQYFYFDVETSPFLFDPLHIKALEDYINVMPLSSPSLGTDSAPFHYPLSRDPYINLPPEILTEILLTLSEDSFTALLAASPATCQVRLMPSFWRKRVEIHMSWSWEIIAHVALNEQSYNWEKIYNDLERFSKLDKTNEKDFLGFANRRRIYNVCRQLTPSYVQLENEAQAASPTGDSEEMLRTAKCQHFVSVSMPLVSAFNSTNTFMLHRWSDIAHEEKVLDISWNSSGALAGIALTIRGVRSAVEGSEIGAGAVEGLRTNTLVIQEGDWIDGFLFFMSAPEPKIIGVTVRTLRSPGTTFGSTNGAGLRLMSVDNGNVFVGLKAAATTDSISKLGILECPLPSSVDLPLSPPKVDAATRKMIWKNQLPPPSVRALPFHIGYNNCGDEATESGQIMEFLIFGESEAQLHTLTGIAVSADFLGFFAYHNDAEPSSIGLSKRNLKHFSIDGPGGERVVKLSLGVGSTPVGLKVLTNRGRQGIFGMLRESHCLIHDYAASGTTNSNEAIAGVYGSFEIIRGYSRFTAFGVLCAPSTSSQPLPLSIPPSPGAWDPTPPPPHWHAEGPVYGSSEHYALTYLDLTKPISKISGLLAAPEWYDIVELGGFVVTYVDGSTCYVGMPTDQWREVEDAESGSAVVKRHEGMSHGIGEADEGVVAHVTTAEAWVQNRDTGPGACWDLGPNGACLGTITVWAGKYLNGVQLHTVDGRASPRWGKCGGRESTVITTDASSAQNSDVVAHSRGVGVKFYLDSHRDHHNASDAQPVGLQALVTV